MTIDENLQKLLDQYEKHHSADNIAKRDNMSTQIYKTFTKSIDDFLIEKHGSVNGVPKMYHLGTSSNNFEDASEWAEDIFLKAAKNLLPYAFPHLAVNEKDSDAVKQAKEDKLKVVMELYENDPEHLEGMMAHKFGIRKGDFIEDLTKNRKNVWNSQEIENFTRGSGQYASEFDVRQTARKLYKHENIDGLREKVSGHLKELNPGYEVDAKKLGMNQIANLLPAIYKKDVALKTYAKDNPKIVYKPK